MLPHARYTAAALMRAAARRGSSATALVSSPVVRQAAARLPCVPVRSTATATAASSKASTAAAAAGGAAPRTAAPASASPPAPAKKQELYRSPLRDADDKTYDHLWENAWVLDAPQQRHTIIWLHGLGQDTSTLHTMADILSPPRTKFVVPQAPRMSITALPDAPDQRAWFDIIVEQRDAAKEKEGEMMEEDEVGIEEMTRRVHDLIEHEMQVAGLPSSHILLAGFGEGGALALHAAMTFPQRLAGVVSLAGYLPLPHLYPECITPAARGAAGTPVLCVHGNSDFVVPLAFSQARYQLLKQAQQTVEVRTEWSMGHFLSNTSLMATQGWMTDALNKSRRREEEEQQQQQAQKQKQ